MAKIATLCFNVKTSPSKVKETDIKPHHHHGPTCGCGAKAIPVKAFDLGDGSTLVKYRHPEPDKGRDEKAFAA